MKSCKENMKVDLFDKPFLIKNIGCRTEATSGGFIPPSINLFVKVTNNCNAGCHFCSNGYHAYDRLGFNLEKLWHIIDILIANQIIVNRVNITGGEPAIVANLVYKILDKASEDKYSSLHFHLNTNGLLPTSQELMRHSRWNSISVSLHHYDLETLSQIYGAKIGKNALTFRNINLDTINASCNLIKGYIDSPSEVEKMLKFVVSLGLPRLGFVALMKINDYCKNHFVDFDEIDFTAIPHLYFTESRNRGKDCKCSNYLFNHNGKILEVYMRNYANPHYCESSLLFDGLYLRQGFHDDNIIF